MSKEPNPQQILAIILGASSYQKSPRLAQGRMFYNSAQDFLEYLNNPDGMNVPRENINFLFDDSRSPSDQISDIADFIETRSQELKSKATDPQDIIIYYVGHGLFWGGGRDYCLAVRATDQRGEGPTSIRTADLAHAIKNHARFLRKFIILDCCFSGAAYTEFQSAPAEVGRVKLLEEFPNRGTTLLCAASAKDAALAPSGMQRTLFSDGLLRALAEGHPFLGPRISFSDLGDLVKEILRNAYSDKAVRPEVLSPDQREGNVANVGLFPNPQYQPDDRQRSEGQERKPLSAKNTQGSQDAGKPAAQPGDAAAQALLGWNYENGLDGRPKDEREAASLYKLAADQGHAWARNQLGRYYRDGRGGLAKDDKEALRLFRLAADQGHSGAYSSLGHFHENGRGGLAKDDKEAARLYKLAADQGDSWAQAQLGWFHSAGLGGLAKDDKEAARLYKLAADQGNRGAQYVLGTFYDNGRGGLAKDDKEAARYYRLAADQGHPAAQAQLGWFYNTGRGGLAEDENESVRLYKLAADQGYAGAQNNLGTFYENGRGGLDKDETEAARLYKLAADQGFAAARNNLGTYYENGRGGLAKDETEAARLYKLAADQGYSLAQYNLGTYYENGRGGLEKDETEAARLYKLAADQGYARAQDMLRNLLSRQTA